MEGGNRIRREALADWRPFLRVSAWTLTACLIVAGILFLLVETGLIEGPGIPKGVPNDYVTRLGYLFADERAIFPYEIAAAILFSIAFVALAAIGAGLRSLTPARDTAGSVVAGAFLISAVLLVVSQLAFIGAKRVAIDPDICECPRAAEQLISQDRSLQMFGEMSDWVGAGGLLIGGLGMLAVPTLARRSGALSTQWARASQFLAGVLLVAVIGVIFELETLFDITAGVASVILLPAWAIWLDRQVRTTS